MDLLLVFLLDQLDPRYHQNAVKPLFATVKALIELRPAGACKFILGYVSRFKRFDTNHFWGLLFICSSRSPRIVHIDNKTS